MKKLIARRPVLYLGRGYARGDALPAHDPKMVVAWLRAGSAAWSVQEGPRDASGTGDGQELAGDAEPAQEVRNGRRDGKQRRRPEQ